MQPHQEPLRPGSGVMTTSFLAVTFSIETIWGIYRPKITKSSKMKFESCHCFRRTCATPSGAPPSRFRVYGSGFRV